MAKQDATTLNGLAAKVQELTQQFTQYLQENKIPEPSFAADSPTSYSGLDGPSFVLRQALFDTLMDLVYLTQGPSESVFNYVHTVGPDSGTLSVLNHFDFWSAVPLNGSASYEEISEKTTLPVQVCQRLVEHGATLRLFSVTSDGTTGAKRVHHTSRSAAIAQNQGLKALVSTILDDAGPSMSVMPETLRRYTAGKPALTQNVDETAFAVLNKNGGPFGSFKTSWELLENDGEGERKGWRQRNFAVFMRYVNDIFQFEKIIEEGYDWAAAGNIRVIDVGGSGGHDSIALAKRFPNLTLMVQDLGEAEPVFQGNLPQELKDRVSFKAHDFFNPQTTQADVFLMKLILHDWPDKESAQILRNLIPGMKPGSKLLFIDYVGKNEEKDADKLPRSLQAFGTATDIRMMALFNHRERLAWEWKEVFKLADERFEITRMEANPLTFVVLMEVTWRG